MSDQQDIKQHLQQWAQTYGGSQFERLGYVGKDRLQRPELPQGDTLPDRVERAVQRMETNGRWKEARVLRAEVFMATLPETERMQRLSSVGLRVGRTAYYVYLKSAIAFLEGALSSEPSNDPDGNVHRSP